MKKILGFLYWCYLILLGLIITWFFEPTMNQFEAAILAIIMLAVQHMIFYSWVTAKEN